MWFSGEHDKLKRRAAIKVLRSELSTDKQESARFTAEARLVSRIDHPNLIDVFDIGELPDGRLYYVMEHLTGRSLSSVMKQGRLPFSAFAPLLRQTCEGLQAAHDAGLVHRDLKPDNLFLVERPGEAPVVKILDFGVAKSVTAESTEERLTRTGNIVGTPQYMSPEQIDGSTEIDRRSDIYALGVILYELATGSLPFRAETIGQMLKAHLMSEVPKFDPGNLAEGVPPQLEAVIFKALAKQKEDRYPDAMALAADLDRVSAGLATDAAVWWSSELQKRETQAKLRRGDLTLGGAQTQLAGLTQSGTIVGTLAGTLLVGPQARRWQTAVALGGGAFALLLLLGGALLWKRGNDLKKAQENLIALRKLEREKEAAQKAAAEKAKRKGIDILALRSQALSILTEGLKDGDPALRARAALALGQSRDTRHRTLLEPLLKDADGAVKNVAVTALGQLGARAALPSLNPLVEQGQADKNRDTASWITLCEALDRLGDPMGETLLKKAVRGKEEDAKLRAAMVLVDKGEPNAKKALQKRLKAKGLPQPERLPLLAQLAKIRDAAATKELNGLLAAEDTPPEMQVPIALALAKAGDEEARTKLSDLARKAGPAQLRAARALSSLGDPTGYDLFRGIFVEDKRSLQERVVAAEGLGACGEKTGAPVLSTAFDKEGKGSLLRQVAASAVLQIAAGDPQVLAQQSISWAEGALGDSDWSVRESAVALLGDSDPQKAVPLLGKAMKDERLEVRRSAALALGRTKSRTAVTVLADAVADNEAPVRVAVVRAIGQVGSHLRKQGEKAVDQEVEGKLKTALLGLSDKGDAGEQVVAAATLLRLGDESRKDKLKDAIGSKDPEIRKLAVEEAKADPQAEKTVLEKALGDPSFAVRLRAAQELAGQGNKDGVAVLREALKKGGPDALAAYGALKKLGEEAEPPAGTAKLLESNKVEQRLAAVDAAARLPQKEALDLLKKAAKDPDASVRRRVVEVAGDLPVSGGTHPALPVLKSLLDDEDVAVRSRAAALTARYSPKPVEVPEPKDVGKKESTVAAPALATPDLLVAPDLLQPVLDLSQPPAPDLAVAQVVPDLASAPKEDPKADPKAEGKPDKGKDPEKAAAKDSKEDAREEAQIKLAAGELFLQNGKYEKAVRELEQARRLDPKLAVTFSLGEAYRKWADGESDLTKQKKLIQKAIDSYKKAKDPKAKAYIDELKERLE